MRYHWHIIIYLYIYIFITIMIYYVKILDYSQSEGHSLLLYMYYSIFVLLQPPCMQESMQV